MWTNFTLIPIQPTTVRHLHRRNHHENSNFTPKMSSLKTHTVFVTDLRQPPQSAITFLTSHRPWGRKRSRRRSFLVIRSSSNNQLTSFLPQLDLLTPALAFTTAVALLRKFNPSGHQIGDWSLITSPTPFNRFVKLRCASLEDSNENLIEEDGRVVSIDTGRIPQIRSNGGTDDRELGKRVVYQRICVNTDDGGVLSLDWPADLELTMEHGLDTTVLIVAGTTDGSMDENVRSFVCECLTRGCFPIVMNPRGCARSPLTTPRLFTAADSDDICTAVQFINRVRPWSTFMAVGFSYGANMLTKYLAEVGDETPLTAATCLDNPFDLEEASNNLFVNQNLTRGLIDLLQSNKELFLGRSKGFDVEKALQAKSLKDFDEAISMVSYGFDSIKEFYAISSSGNFVGDVKIPLLFIQNNAMSSFSIPRSLIEENPFTSLLICNFQSDDKRATRTFDVSWCQHLVVEWLTAVELGFLKGRHPLLEDSDVTISPSKQMTSHKSIRSNNFLNFQLNGNTSYSRKKMLKRSDAYVNSNSGLDLQMSEVKDKDITNGTVTQTNLIDLKDDDVDSERGKMLQATEVVMNMLDVTMPEALSEEQKLKVLTAVGQGETLMNALQDAVPEDVRGKLTSSVTAILENQKKNLNEPSRVPDATSALYTKMQERSVGPSSVEKEANGLKINTSLTEEVNNNHPYGKNDDDNRLQSTSNEGGELSHSGPTSNRDQSGNDDFIKQKFAQIHDSDSSVMHDNSKKMEKSEDHVSDQVNLGREGGTNVENDDQHKNASEYSTSASSADVAKENDENQKKEESSAQPGSADMAKQNVQNQKKEESSAHPGSADVAKENYENEKKDESSAQAGSADMAKQNVQNQKNEESNAQPGFADVAKENDESQKKDESSAQPGSADVAKENVQNQKKEESSAHPGSADVAKENGENQKKEESSAHLGSADMAKENGENQKKNESNAHPGSADVAKVNGENQKKDELSAQPGSSSNSPSFSVSQALDALTGMDDSTQVAVNSVFSVIADVITQLEEKRDNGSTVENDNNSSTDSKIESDENGDEKSNKKSELKKVGNHQQIMSISTKRENEANKNPVNIQHSITKLPYNNSLYDQYIQRHLNSKMKNDKSIESDAATALYLDFVPEEGQWKLIDQSGDPYTNYVDDVDVTSHEKSLPSDDDIIEPSYVILDAEGERDPVGDVASVQISEFVRASILKSLEVEVSRRIQATDMTEIALALKKELEDVANTISLAVLHDKQDVISWDGEKLVGFGNLQDKHVLDAIYSAVRSTRYMKELVPVGIVVGASLASLRKIINTNAADFVTDQISVSQEGFRLQTDKMTADEIHFDKVDQNIDLNSEDEEKNVSNNLSSDTVMVGAVTAALGASALLVHQQNSYSDELESSSMSHNQEENDVNHHKLEEETSKSGDNIVTSLAEKAMLVAGPVVPTREDGAVDQERLVALLADLGQKGGILKLVGKIALLWGGIRGAMSLTGKLISFLRLAERSLFQRILGFGFMVLVLWTPVVVPLLPTLVQNWATHNSAKYAELACIIGLYSSIMILVVLWGKRIRGYEDPLERYGLELTAPTQIQNFAYGLIGGVTLVMLIQYTNMLLGFVTIIWPTIPSSTDAVTLLKLFGKVVRFVGQGFVTAVTVALVEELLFRSWLTEEIAVDLGYHQGIILSGLAFSLSQWSLNAILGVWLLSLGLAGVKQRCQGRLSIPIGLRAGILITNFFLKEGGFLIYQKHKTTNYPSWLTGGGDHFQPFNSIVGLAVAFLWAAILYPEYPQFAEEESYKLKENIKE